MIRLLATAAALACAAAALPPYREMNLTLADTSPLLTYDPAVNDVFAPRPDGGDPSETWNVSYAASSWDDWEATAVGRGASRHTTSVQGATVEVSWVGSAVYFYGEGDVALTIDGTPAAGLDEGHEMGPMGSLIAGYAGLEPTYHTAKITILNGTVSLTRVVVTTGFTTDARIATTAPRWNYTGTDPAHPFNINGPIQTWAPPLGAQWNTHDLLGPAGDQVPFARIDTSDPGAYATFKVPPNTAFMTVFGSVNADHGNYSVQIVPDPPKGPRGKRFFNGYSPWGALNQVLFATALDPTQSYAFNLTNEQGGKWLDLYMVEFYNGTLSVAPEDKLAGGAIAGIVIGVVLFLALIAVIFIFFFLRARRREGQRRQEEDVYIVCDARITAATAMSSPNAAQATGKPEPYPRGTTLVVPARARTLGLSPMSEFIRSPTTHTSTEYPGFSQMKRELTARRDSTFEEDSVSYVTDTDAGTFGDSTAPSARSVPVHRVHLMPPTYNPQWAGCRAARSGSDTSNMSSLESTLPPSTRPGSEYMYRHEPVVLSPELWTTPLSAASSITRPHGLATRPHSLATGPASVPAPPPPPVLPPPPTLPPLVVVNEEEVVVGRFVTYDSPVPFDSRCDSPPPPVPPKD